MSNTATPQIQPEIEQDFKIERVPNNNRRVEYKTLYMTPMMDAQEKQRQVYEALSPNKIKYYDVQTIIKDIQKSLNELDIKKYRRAFGKPDDDPDVRNMRKKLKLVHHNGNFAPFRSF